MCPRSAQVFVGICFYRIFLCSTPPSIPPFLAQGLGKAAGVVAMGAVGALALSVLAVDITDVALMGAVGCLVLLCSGWLGCGEGRPFRVCARGISCRPVSALSNPFFFLRFFGCFQHRVSTKPFVGQ